LPNDFAFRRELALAYRDMGYETTFFENPCQHYKLACSVDDDGINMQYHLHVGDAVAIFSKEVEVLQLYDQFLAMKEMINISPLLSSIGSKLLV
jgi:hypothetical protein